MDAQYKMITKTAHLITKESSQEEANEMFATMSGLKEQLTKVGEHLNAPHMVPDHSFSLLIPSLSPKGKLFTP